ncbi:MAG: class I SAM-dependent methyltransferase [Candidatus Omnitrophota bacterium]|jgi:SAM-dependent methyltransferase
MPEVFRDYSRIYDIIYRKKDYCKECRYLDRIFRRYTRIPVKDILDVACGTGNHAVSLSAMGYRVFGQDISKGMLKEARRKCAGDKNIRIIGSFPMQKFCHSRKFDACVAMFSSVDYILKIGQLRRAFKNIFSCLKPGGIFTFDFWNADCVTRSFSPYKRGVFICGNKKVERVSRTGLDKAKMIANIGYTCRYYDNGDFKATITEKHLMKYHDIKSMLKLVESCGFRVAGVFPFMKIGYKVRHSDWNISVVAVK